MVIAIPEQTQLILCRGCFLKIEKCCFGLHIPKSHVAKSYNINLRVYLQAENILTITGYSGLIQNILMQAKCR